MPTLLAALTRFLEAAAPVTRARLLAPHIERAQTRLGAAFTKQGRLLLAELRTRHVQEAIAPPVDPSIVDDGLNAFDAVAILTLLALADPIDELAASAMQAGGMETIAELGVDLSFNLSNPRAVQYLQRHGADQVTRIDATTRERLRALLVDGVAAGDSYTTTASNITAMFQDISTARATRIAVYESAVAYESGKRVVVDDLQTGGLTVEKSTLTAGDDRVEEDCLANEADGWIPLDQPHSSGEQQAPYHFGCRCAELYRTVDSNQTA